MFLDLGVRGGRMRYEVVAGRGWVAGASYEGMLGVCSQIVVLTQGCAYRW